MHSLLRCEPNLDTPRPEILIAGAGKVEHLWQVWVDSRLIAETAMPIGPADSWIELEAHDRYAIRGDGYRVMSVRRVRNWVVWFNSLDRHLRHRGLVPDEMPVFQFDQYVAETTRCMTLDSHGLDLSGELPELSLSEMNALLRVSFPGDNTTIYTSPALLNDQTGMKLINRVRYHLIESGADDVRFVDEPNQPVDLTIGLDIDDNPECHWRVGRDRAGLAIQFLARPCFPLWLGGDPVDAALTQILDNIIPQS